MRAISYVTIFFLGMSLMFACRSHRPSGAKTFRVTGSATQTSVYCGGARPSDEMMESYSRPKPYPKKKLVVQMAGDHRALPLQVVTNDSGYFFLDLPAGTYRIFQEEQMNPPALSSLNKPGFVHIDSVCFEKWKIEPLSEIVLSDRDTVSVNINFHRPCFIAGDIPCQHYIGPMPP